MELPAPDEIVKHPEFIRYLLSPNTPLDFHINVGNTNAATPEKLGQIKVVKWMLIAHSKVLRVMLHESEMRPDKSFNITDINQNTFKNFLVFVYGHDDMKNLPFDDAVDLLSLAEKYDVATLKGKLALLLKSRVCAENVVTILKYGLVCETVPDLWAKATDVIQTETAAVFSHPEFKTLCPEAVVHILQQDALSVDEIDVWRASLAWARHQLTGVSAEPTPQDMRRTLEPLLVHTRLCTVPLLYLSKEAALTEILTGDEFKEIMISIVRQVKSENLTSVCNKIEGRKSLVSLAELRYLSGASPVSDTSIRSKIVISTKSDLKIMLVALSVPTNPSSWSINSKYTCRGNVIITQLPLEGNSANDEELLESKTIPFDLEVTFDVLNKIPLQDESGKCPVLNANSNYSFEIEFTSGSHRLFLHSDEKLQVKDFKVSFTSHAQSCRRVYCFGEPPPRSHASHIGQLHYIRLCTN